MRRPLPRVASFLRHQLQLMHFSESQARLRAPGYTKHSGVYSQSADSQEHQVFQEQTRIKDLKALAVLPAKKVSQHVRAMECRQGLATFNEGVKEYQEAYSAHLCQNCVACWEGENIFVFGKSWVRNISWGKQLSRGLTILKEVIQF